MAASRACARAAVACLALLVAGAFVVDAARLQEKYVSAVIEGEAQAEDVDVDQEAEALAAIAEQQFDGNEEEVSLGQTVSDDEEADSNQGAGAQDVAQRFAQQLGCWRKTYKINEVVAKSTEWCDVSRVSKRYQVPAKLQGLFWMRGSPSMPYPIPDVLACLSLGWYHKSRRLLVVHVLETFMWMNNPPGVIGQLLTPGNYYAFKFTSDKLEKASIKPFAIHVPGMVFSWFMDTMSDFLMEDASGGSGDLWLRPTITEFNGKQMSLTYHLVRLMNGAHKVLESNYKEFQKTYTTVIEGDVWKMFGANGEVSVMKCPHLLNPPGFITPNFSLRNLKIKK